MAETDLPGLDLDAFAAYFGAAHPGAIDGLLRGSVLPGASPTSPMT
jgi:hypothetical protein